MLSETELTGTAGTSFPVFKSVADTKVVFHDAGVSLEPDAPIIASCGSGVTAAVLVFALVRSGKALSDISIYDGSWSEWVSSQS